MPIKRKNLRKKSKPLPRSIKKSAKKTPAKRLTVNRKVKKAVRKRQPLHRRLLLHPLSLMVLLGVGVLLVGTTFHIYAASYTVTAEVKAPIPASPAIITDPTDQTHVTTQQVNVSGSCPINSYVNLYTNSIFTGTDICTNTGAFQIATDLQAGSNSLQVEVFNITNDEGPTSSAITVYYDQPSVATQPAPLPPAPKAPVALDVYAVDHVVYQTGLVVQTNLNPTVTGLAPAGSRVVVTFHTDTLTCVTYANSLGIWTCTLDQALPSGTHTVDVVATTPAGSVLTYPHEIQIVASGTKQASGASTTNPFYIKVSYEYQVYGIDKPVVLNLSVAGGVAPYAWTISWGDGGLSTILSQGESTISPSHSYTSAGTYTIKIGSADSIGSAALVQIPAVVKDRQLTSLVAGSTNKPSSSSLSNARHWLWAVWPAYLVLLLMIFSFWLGEREEYREIASLKKRVRSHART